MTARERALLRRRALVEVVAPCLDALLSIEATVLESLATASGATVTFVQSGQPETGLTA